VSLTLIESQRKANPKQALSVGFVSLTIHTAVIAGAVFATLNAGRGDAAVQFDTTLVMLGAPQPQRPPEQPAQLDVPLKGFQTIVVPDVIPTTVPPVDLREHSDPRDFSGTGVEGGRGTGITPGDDVIYAESAVEEAPTLLSAAPLAYPELLRQAGIQGTVLLQAVVDTAGRVVPGSIRIVRTPHPGFEASAKQWVLSALFRPARIQGRPVRVLVNQPLQYSIARTAGRR